MTGIYSNSNIIQINIVVDNNINFSPEIVVGSFNFFELQDESSTNLYKFKFKVYDKNNDTLIL